MLSPWRVSATLAGKRTVTARVCMLPPGTDIPALRMQMEILPLVSLLIGLVSTPSWWGERLPNSAVPRPHCGDDLFCMLPQVRISIGGAQPAHAESSAMMVLAPWSDNLPVSCTCSMHPDCLYDAHHLLPLLPHGGRLGGAAPPSALPSTPQLC